MSNGSLLYFHPDFRTANDYGGPDGTYLTFVACMYCGDTDNMVGMYNILLGHRVWQTKGMAKRWILVVSTIGMLLLVVFTYVSELYVEEKTEEIFWERSIEHDEVFRRY